MESLSFSATRLRALFNEGLGFRVLDSGMENQMIGFYPRLAKKNLKRFKENLNRLVPMGSCLCFILCGRVGHVRSFAIGASGAFSKID
ncbi:hypothetical protein [Pseudorhodobacter sp.]|uniref:hypothetical protein n=1 Tax=Pseudorhodobacter sp. TaxID=1934400 RepID=UPI002AFF8608|nr:hypothetical protein [Pseudorhodobacter sp.]